MCIDKISAFPRSERQIAEVEQTVKQHLSAIEALDQDIEVLSSHVRRLKAQKAEHLAHVRRYQGMTCTARKLPIELLAKIVQFASIDNAKAPLHVSQVCSEWRAIIHLPSLWNLVDLTIEEHASRSLAQASLWISRAKDLPLHTTLRFGRQYPALELITLLNHHMVRFQTLAIYVPFSYLLPHALGTLRSDYPNLKALSLNTTQVYMEEELVPLADNQLDLLRELGELPSLKEIHVTSSNLHVTGFPAGLTTISVALTISSPNNDPIRGVFSSLIHSLSQLPSLQELRIDTLRSALPPADFEWATDRSPVVDLLQLKKLSLTSYLEYFDILSHLRAPTLETLILYCSGGDLSSARSRSTSPRHTGSLVLNFLTSSASPSIQSISLQDIDIDHDTFFPSLFRLTPELRELRLHDVVGDGNEMRYLQGPANCCPKLEKIDLRWCSSVTGKDLVDLVASRLEPQGTSENTKSHSSIREVTVVNCLHVKDEDIASLAQLTLCRVRIRAGDDFCC